MTDKQEALPEPLRTNSFSAFTPGTYADIPKLRKERRQKQLEIQAIDDRIARIEVAERRKWEEQRLTYLQSRAVTRQIEP